MADPVGERERAGISAGGLVGEDKGRLLEDGEDGTEDGKAQRVVRSEGLQVQVCSKDELLAATVEGPEAG